jgi:hypothetical protein
MPSTFEWPEKIKSVEREHSAMRIAADSLIASVSRNPGQLEAHIRIRDVQRAADRLDGTYIIRLFAEFEAGLREFRKASKPQAASAIRARDLLDSIAANQRIPHDQHGEAHKIREFRNAFLHDHLQPAATIAVRDARASLCKSFSFLPPSW